MIVVSVPFITWRDSISIPNEIRYLPPLVQIRLNCPETTAYLKTSVAIIGAGPAGAATSIFLSKAGIDHVLIDKAVFPRDKVCGDGCSGKTVHVLRSADPAWLGEIFDDAARFLPSNGIIFVSPNGRHLDIPFAPVKDRSIPSPGFTVPRLQFDDFLFRKTGSPHATVIQDAQTETLLRNDKGILVRYRKDGQQQELQASFVVGADGEKSLVRKTFLAGHAESKAGSVGLRAYYKNVGGLHPGNHIELHFLPEVLPGYFWIFPLPNGMANVGIGMPSELVRRKKLNLREMMLKAMSTNPWIRERFSGAELQGKILGWGLPMYQKNIPMSGERFLLTGDAAHLIDPFTGEGIGNALYSGKMAAEALQKALAEGRHDPAFFQGAYDAEWRRRMGQELRTSQTLQRLSSRPWLFNMVVGKAAKSPSLQQTISAMIGNNDLRDNLRRPSFYLDILLNR